MLRLRRERILRGMTQMQVAVGTGIHPATLSHLELGNVRAWPGYQRTLEAFFDVPAEQLFSEMQREDQGRS